MDSPNEGFNRQRSRVRGTNNAKLTNCASAAGPQLKAIKEASCGVNAAGQRTLGRSAGGVGGGGGRDEARHGGVGCGFVMVVNGAVESGDGGVKWGRRG
jgi:hypothetical protein